VEVLHDRGQGRSSRWALGSGFVLRTNVVVTAAHNLGDSPDECGPEGTTVRTMDGEEHEVVSVMARSDVIDMAVLAVPGLAAEPIEIGQVDRSRIDVVHNVMAVGFPNYKYAADKPARLRRQPAQPVGMVPTTESYTSGTLVLKLEDAGPAPVDNGSPWEGLSGAGVFVEERLLGVVIEHRFAEGLCTLHFVPFSSLLTLTEHEQALFCAVLGILNLKALPHANGSPTPIDGSLVSDLKEIRELENQGYLDPSEASVLRIEAVKQSKGWVKG
jgi:hypothetical protein